VRELTIHEQLCLYQMLLAMDSVLEGLNPAGRLPFEDAPLPEVYTSIFWGLWGGSGGGTVQEPEEREIVEDNLISAETHNKKGREEKFREDISEEGGCRGTTPHKKGREKTGREDISTGAGCGGTTSHGPLTPETTYEENGECDEEASMVVKLRPASTLSLQEHEMTANKPDMLPCTGDCKPAGNWTTFELNFESGADKGRLTDADTITSVASEETMCCHPWRPGDGNMLEEHEIGLGPN
jgi:hypothetical protein